MLDRASGCVVADRLNLYNTGGVGMKDFFDGLIPKIQEAIMEDFRDIKKQIGDETIYAAVLATDSDCITLGLWINTVEKIEPKDIEYGFYDKEEYIEDNKDFLSPEEID